MQELPWEDYQRLPDLDETGKRILQKIIQHPHAPIFRNRSGHFLTKEQQEKLQQQETEEAKKLITPNIDLSNQNKISQLTNFISNCQHHVPFYKEYHWQKILEQQPMLDQESPASDSGLSKKGIFSSSPQGGVHGVSAITSRTFAPTHLKNIPTISRSNLQENITAFVPNNLSIDQLIAFNTNGTTGHPIIIPSHPEIAARYSWFHKKALRWNGIEPDDFNSDVAVLLAGYQQQCFTYASLIHSLNNKGLIKTNFYPADWPSPESRAIYLDAMKPDVITGDPLSLYELMQLNSQHKPKAILSTSMALLPQQQKCFEDYWQCPVINIYSMNEAGPIAASVRGEKGLRLLQSNMLIEIVDAEGNSQTPGQSGEITITHAINDYLPLLRYRTGDFARLEKRGDYWYLMDLEGRPPVKYKTASGQWLNNVDITHALHPFALPQYQFHQNAQSHIRLRIRGAADAAAIQSALQKLLGASITIQIDTHQDFADKVIQYTSDLASD
jgi:phenylacetate-CoA ligase